MYEKPVGSMAARNLVDAHQLKNWQTRWDTARTCRNTHVFFLNVRDQLKCKWIRSSHHITWLLAGLGAFKSKLHALGLKMIHTATATNQRKTPSSMFCTHALSTTRSAAITGGDANQKSCLTSGDWLLDNKGRLRGCLKIYQKIAPHSRGRRAKAETNGKMM